MRHFLCILEDVTRKLWHNAALSNYRGESFTHADVAAEMARFHVLFGQIGIHRGDKIAIAARNSAQWATAFLASATYHAVAVPILADFTADNIRHLVNHSESVLLFTDKQHWNEMREEQLPLVKAVIDVDDFTCMYAANKDVRRAFDSLDDAYCLAFPTGLAPEMIHYACDDLDELVVINYTSGTTGEPKGIMLSARSISSNICYSHQNIPVCLGDQSISMLPLAHMYGLTIEFLYAFLGGANVYFLTQIPSPSVLMKAIADIRPFILITVPLVLEKIVKNKVIPVLHKPVIRLLTHIPLVNRIIYHRIHESVMSAFGGRVSAIPLGGAALNADVEKVLRKLRIPYTVGYGMTECGPLIGFEHASRFVFGSCGKVVDGMQIRVDSANPCKVVGELQVKGDHVMLGYYRNEVATRASFTDDGWFRTGDLGVIDKHGNIFIKGRSKCMILTSNGQNIYPEEIESRINDIPIVSESLVLERNNSLVALVALQHDKLQTIDVKVILKKLLADINSVLPSYCRISKIEIVRDGFVHTPKHSIKRCMYK